ncbi:Predicted ATPase [Roseateles sp. YR242]|uniref:ATP-binding protein n=1 Tax=Roseateles sp. YR242 TaxID=1855305 RepID=UPI0008C25207|nr:winged helix-turn-helix domain-containing protein [Roseateles sp. YR242]SEK63065.1 Predicted ATPase [Roseateles sp. YR242]
MWAHKRIHGAAPAPVGSGDDPPSSGPTAYAFGRFVLIPERQVLMEHHQPVHLGSRALDILTLLVQRAGALVGKDEILARVWAHSVVEDSNIKVNMAALRRALEGDGSHRAFIATTRGRGYRFVGIVQQIHWTETTALGAGGSLLPRRLPALVSPLVGRHREAAALMDDVEQHRLVSLVGPAGVGKTSLALSVATQLAEHYRHGACLVDLAAVTDPSTVPATVAAALDLSVEGPAALSALCRCLEHQELLLMLDTCDAQVDAAAHCADELLRRCPGLRLLVTCREPLSVSGECVRRLRGLALPRSASRLTTARAMCFPAIRLLLDRAAAHSRGFVLQEGEAGKAAELCRRLDGLPLAIELAATQLVDHGLDGLLQQLDIGLQGLGARRGGPERHRSLDAAQAWGWRHLSAREVRLLMAASALDGDFDVQKAAVMASRPGSGLEALSRPELVGVLSALARKSLLTRDLRDGAPRYRLPETTRAHGHARMAREAREAARPEHPVRPALHEIAGRPHLSAYGLRAVRAGGDAAIID